MVINVSKLAKKAREKTPDLLTRPVGRKMYGKLIESIDIISSGEVVVLDFENIKVIDSSFIDEFIVKFIRNSKNDENDYYVKLRNISPITEINIGSVFRSYSDYDDKKIVVMTEDICLNNNFYIGNLIDVEKDIIDYIRINKSAAAKDIVRITGMTLNKVKEIMENLNCLRLVRQLNGSIFGAV